VQFHYDFSGESFFGFKFPTETLFKIVLKNKNWYADGKPKRQHKNTICPI
jgi:hypothetical protein